MEHPPQPNLQLDELFSVTYEELRRLAASVRRGERSETLSPTALVNEAYLKLSASSRLAPASIRHFQRIAARAMRQVLIEASRRRKALKRGGTELYVTLDDESAVTLTPVDELLALDDAIRELERVSPRQARLIEYRFFGGLELTEAAELLQVSESTIARDWRAARAWLAVRLRDSEDHPVL